MPDERHPETWTVWALRTFSGIAKPRRTGRVEAIAVSGLDARVPGRWRVEL